MRGVWREKWMCAAEDNEMLITDCTLLCHACLFVSHPTATVNTQRIDRFPHYHSFITAAVAVNTRHIHLPFVVGTASEVAVTRGAQSRREHATGRTCDGGTETEEDDTAAAATVSEA